MKSGIIGIYHIKNLINKKVYIGKSTDIKGRFLVHISKLRRNKHLNTHLQNAWNKHGEENFEFKIIKKCSLEELKNNEIKYIKKFKSLINKSGYNLTGGGEGSEGHSDETKRKISEKAMGRVMSEEVRRIMSMNNKGRIVTPETREKISIANLGIPKNLTGKYKLPEDKKLSKKEAKLRRRHTSEFLGVCYMKQINRWKTYISIGKKMHHVLYSKLEIDAARAYDKYVIENNLPNPLNFPEDYPERGESK